MEKFEFQISVIESEDLHGGDKHDDLGKVVFQIHTMFIIESIIYQSFLGVAEASLKTNTWCTLES
ncbi:unnamed protein product [Rhodiola kirilowii]